jgi:triacylglycerol lipase
MNIPKLRAPIVLVHGLMGFGRMRVAGMTLASYFPGIVEALEAAGNRVLVPALSPTHGVETRARELKAFLLKHSPTEPVHLIAHSMGGLDSRYMISRLGMADHVLTLITLGTPHRGTAFADWGVETFSWVVQPVLKMMGIPYQAFHDLTTAQCQAFNAAVPDAPHVRYFSVAGRFHGSWRAPEWLIPHQIVLRNEGPNDGVVSVDSARYGETFDVWDGDHLSLVNWPHLLASNRTWHRDPTPRYAALVQKLADMGY